MVDGAEFQISCKLPAFLSSFSRLQVWFKIHASTFVWRQCDIRMQVLQVILAYINNASRLLVMEG